MENTSLQKRAQQAHRNTEDIIDELINEIERLEDKIADLEAEIEELKEQ